MGEFLMNGPWLEIARKIQARNSVTGSTLQIALAMGNQASYCRARVQELIRPDPNTICNPSLDVSNSATIEIVRTKFRRRVNALLEGAQSPVEKACSPGILVAVL